MHRLKVTSVEGGHDAIYKQWCAHARRIAGGVGRWTQRSHCGPPLFATRHPHYFYLYRPPSLSAARACVPNYESENHTSWCRAQAVHRAVFLVFSTALARAGWARRCSRGQPVRCEASMYSRREPSLTPITTADVRLPRGQRSWRVPARAGRGAEMASTMQLEFTQAMTDFKTMFPDMDDDVIEAVLRANQGAVDATIDQLLAMSTDNQNERLRLEMERVESCTPSRRQPRRAKPAAGDDNDTTALV